MKAILILGLDVGRRFERISMLIIIILKLSVKAEVNSSASLFALHFIISFNIFFFHFVCQFSTSLFVFFFLAMRHFYYLVI